MTKLLVLDPLTLIGREFLNTGEALDRLGLEFDFRHTDVDPEHQIAEITGGPALVPPLESVEELEGNDAILVASDNLGSRHDPLLEFLDRDPDTTIIDMARLAGLAERTTPSTGRDLPDERQLRVAHPAMVVASRLFDVLAYFGKLGGTLAIVDPVSEFGKDAVELLAGQSRQRLLGAAVEDMIYGHVRAFNVVAVDAFDLQEEAALVAPNVPLAVTRSLSGVFHGHLAHLGLAFDNPLDPDDVREALSQAEGVEIEDLPVNLDGAADRDHAIITPPVMSPDGRQLAVTAMADGLRVGGALTAIDILENLI